MGTWRIAATAFCWFFQAIPLVPADVIVESTRFDADSNALVAEIREGDERRFKVEVSDRIAGGVWVTLDAEFDGSTLALALRSGPQFFRISEIPPDPLEPAVPFGCLGSDADCVGPSPSLGCGADPVNAWSEAMLPPEISTNPLSFDWWVGPYQNKAGYEAALRVNQWFEEGTAAGLTQDSFRSFDSGHSSVRDFFPQLNILDPKTQLVDFCRNALRDRVTMGVQSLQIDVDIWAANMPLLDVYERLAILSALDRSEFDRISGFSGFVPRSDFEKAYESNFLFVAPALNHYKLVDGAWDDRFTFLTPHYLSSVGVSGSDAALLKPLLYTSAALPPDLKNRILRSGVFVPTMMYLLKSTMSEDYLSASAHSPAYALPEDEAYAPPPEQITLENGSLEGRLDAYKRVTADPSPFLDGLLEAAHNLERIPPIARLVEMEPARILDADGREVEEFYLESSAYGITAALRPGDVFEVVVDLRQSWWDEGMRLEAFHARVLREPGTAASTVSLEAMDGEPGVWRVRIPWRDAEGSQMRRTDIVFVVEDAISASAPAYISVRNLQVDEVDAFGG